MVADLRGGLRVLVVEDNPDCAATTAVLLRLDGHEVRVAGDGGSALLAAAGWPPDVALVDLCLPDMPGCEVARRLAEPSAGKRPFLVAVTGFGSEAMRQR